MKDGHIPNIEPAGTWVSRSRAELDNLSKGLKVDPIETDISSIPDVWARPLLFEMALLNDQHILHQRILGEWRGLLAIIGLKEVLGLDRFTATQVTIPVERDGIDNETTERDFLKTIAKLLPQSSLSADTQWNNLYIFLFNNKAIGLTSPTTLVATAGDCLNRINSQEVGWFKGAYLKDPTDVLPDKQREILAGWLDTLIRNIGGHSEIDKDRWNSLSKLLEAFQKGLGDRCATELSHGAFGIQGTAAGVFRYLDQPAARIMNGVSDSQVRLRPSPGRTPAKPLLVIDKRVAEQWRKRPQDVTVHGAYTLASNNSAVVPDVTLWKVEDFFTERLFAINQKDAFPGTMSAGEAHQQLKKPGTETDITPILPLNKELIEHLTPEEITRSVKWEKTPEGIKIRLFLQLSGPDGKGQTFEAAKVYQREQIVTLDNVPILELWPNFRATGWQAYYVCYSADDITGTFKAEPYTPGANTSLPSEIGLSGKGKRLLWRLESYPEAILCRVSVANQMEEHEAGLLLISPPEEIQPQNTSYKIGFDFGATSTAIYAKVGGNIFKVKFKNRKLSITASGESAQSELFDFFLPKQDVETPVLSVFHDFLNHQDQAGDLVPLLNGHVYLIEAAEDFDASQSGMAVDLKWSEDKSDRARIKAFLTQLCLQTAAETCAAGATNISWAYSYPTAFSDSQLQGYPAIWLQVTNAVQEATGLQPGEGLLAKQTESIAAAWFFQSDRHKASTNLGTIFIDIGGSTSDISVWQKNKPCWQTSLRLAGRDIFSNFIWAKPEFLQVFKVGGDKLAKVKAESQGDKTLFYAQADAILRYNSERIFAQLPTHIGVSAVKELKQHLALGVSGLFYYLGSLLSYLMKKEIYLRETPHIYIGGNGSKMLQWLDVDQDGSMSSLYKAAFSAGAGWPDENPFDVITSSAPKEEAAYGLVCGGPADSSGGNNADGQILAGEIFTKEGKVCQWDSIMTRSDFTGLGVTERLERLEDFVASFNKFANTHGKIEEASLSEKDVAEVRRRLSQSLSEYKKNTNTAQVLPEPVFIIALKHLLELKLGDKR
jgi:hypothetical protein